MLGLLRVLSTSYLRRNPGKTLLGLVGIASGVMTFVGIRAAQVAVTSGLQATVSQLAGAADLEISSPTGVPEAVRDVVQGMEIVEADSPVIEQVVVPTDARLGSLLVVGVDLVGDPLMRPYRFAGEDADVDDPLVFLAQPDSIALSREFAARARLGKGDALEGRVGALVKHFRVRAILESQGLADAYGGNVAVTDVYAAEQAFGRGRRFDRIDLRLRTGTDAVTAAPVIAAAIGPGYDVEPPAARSTRLEQTAARVIRTFGVVTILAGGLGLFVVYHVFSLGVERRRRDVGTLRALGAVPAQILWLFWVEALGLGAVGGLVGLGLGRLIATALGALMNQALAAIQGTGDAMPATLTIQVAAEGLALGVAGALVGACVPARRAATVPPAVALRAGAFEGRSAPLPTTSLPIGGLALVVAWWASRSSGLSAPALLAVSVTPGLVAAVVLAGHATRALVRAGTPVLLRIAPASGRVAVNNLLMQPRRTAARAAVLVVTAAFALGVAGFLAGVRATVDRSMHLAVLGDLIVGTSPGPTSFHLTPEVKGRLAALPEVRAVDRVRNLYVDLRGRTVTITALDPGGVFARAPREIVAGRVTAVAELSIHGDTCVVSDVLAHLFGITAGDRLTLESPTGPVQLVVAAVMAAARARVLIDWGTFAQRWADERVDTLYVSLAPGVDPTVARERVRAALGDSPALVATRTELTAAWNRALETLNVATAATCLVALAVGLVGSTATLAVTAAARTREFGILRAIGATPRQLAQSTWLEGVTLALASLGPAVALGASFAWLLGSRVAVTVAGPRLPNVFPVSVFAALVLLWPAMAVAATWLPLRRRAGLVAAEAIACE